MVAILSHLLQKIVFNDFRFSRGNLRSEMFHANCGLVEEKIITLFIYVFVCAASFGYCSAINRLVVLLLQVPVLACLFFMLFLGNTITTSMVIPQKFHERFMKVSRAAFYCMCPEGH